MKRKANRPTDPLWQIEYDMRLNEFDQHRVARICQTLGCTIHELCAFSGLFDKARIRRLLTKQFWPTELALHFYRLESYYLEWKFGNPTLPDPAHRAAAKTLCRAEQLDAVS